MTVKQSIAAITAAAAIGGGVYEGTVSDGPVDVRRADELVSQRTETSTVYDLGGGKRRAEIATKPVHWRDGDRWKTIDTTVKPKPILRQLVSSRDYETTAGPYTADYETEKPYNYRMVAGGASVAYTARFDTTKAVTVTVEPTTTGVKETVILADDTAPTRLDWTVETGAIFEARGDGGYTADGLVIEPPVAWDAGGKAVKVTASLVKGVYSLTVDTKGAAFPVTVDPTTSYNFIAGSSGYVVKDATDTYSNVRNSTTGSGATAYPLYIDNDLISAGRYVVSRSFMAFPIPLMATISACSLYVDGNSNSSDTDFNVNIYGARSYRSTVTTADFNKFNGWASSGAYGGTILNDTWNTASYSDNWNTLVFNAAGRDSVLAAKSDTLWIALLSSRDVAATQPSGIESISFSGTGTVPYLSITYTVPAVNIHSLKMTPLSATSMKVEWLGNTGADSLALKVYGTNALVEYLNKTALADTITGLNPYTKYRWYIDADSSTVATSTNADSCWTKSEPTTITKSLTLTRDHEVLSAVRDSARVETKSDSIATTTTDGAWWIGQFKQAASYTIWRVSINDVVPSFTRLITATLTVTGSIDSSGTDFNVVARSGSWVAGNDKDFGYWKFDGWSSGMSAYTGTNLLDTWSTSSYGASNVWTYNLTGRQSIYAARGDTLRQTFLSSLDIASTAATRGEYLQLSGAPLLTMSVDLPDSVPTGFTLSAIDPDSLLAAWVDHAHSEYGYVLMDVDTGLKVAGTDTLAANSTSARIGGRTPNTLHRWKIRAVGGGAHGMESGADSTYTLAAAPVAAPTLTFPTGTTAVVVIDTTGTGNPSYTEYAIQDSISGLYVDADGDSFKAEAEWRTFDNWGGAAGDTLAVLTGKKYTIRVKARSGQ